MQEPTTVERPRRKRIVAGVFVLLVAVLASITYLGIGPAGGEGADVHTVMIDVEHGGHCHLLLSPCSELSAVTTAWSVGEPPITIAQNTVLRLAASSDADTLTEAVVLLSTPPPRSA